MACYRDLIGVIGIQCGLLGFKKGFIGFEFNMIYHQKELIAMLVSC